MFESIQAFDLSILGWMQTLQNPVLIWLAWAVSTLAWKGWLWWIVIANSWWRGNRLFATHLAAAIGIATVVGLPLKSIIARPRPDLYASIHLHIPMPELLSTTHSFPSGHTLLAAAFATVVVMYFRGAKAALAVLFVLAVAFARVFQVMHWTSDVIGSAILGVIAAYAAGLVVKLPPVARLINSPRQTRVTDEAALAGSSRGPVQPLSRKP